MKPFDGKQYAEALRQIVNFWNGPGSFHRDDLAPAFGRHKTERRVPPLVLANGYFAPPTAC